MRRRPRDDLFSRWVHTVGAVRSELGQELWAPVKTPGRGKQVPRARQQQVCHRRFAAAVGTEDHDEHAGRREQILQSQDQSAGQSVATANGGVQAPKQCDALSANRESGFHATLLNRIIIGVVSIRSRKPSIECRALGLKNRSMHVGKVRAAVTSGENRLILLAGIWNSAFGGGGVGPATRLMLCSIRGLPPDHSAMPRWAASSVHPKTRLPLDKGNIAGHNRTTRTPRAIVKKGKMLACAAVPGYFFDILRRRAEHG